MPLFCADVVFFSLRRVLCGPSYLQCADMPVGVEKTHALRGLLGSFGLHEKNLIEFLLELLSDLCANSRGLVTALDVSERLAPSMVGGGTEQKVLGTDAAHAVAMGVHCLYALVVSHADMQTLL